MDDLYQEHILDHFSHPRRKGSLECATHAGDQVNASCGDTMHVELVVSDDDLIVDLRWSGQGCAISQATASILSEELVGQPLSQAAVLTLPEIEAMLGVAISPARAKCALLFVHALAQAENGSSTSALDRERF